MADKFVLCYAGTPACWHVKAEDFPRWRHKKRGTTYAEVGRATLQCSRPSELADQDEMVVYRDDDGKLHVRSEGEFVDGRFEKVE